MDDSKHYSYEEIELKSEALLERLRDLDGGHIELPIDIDAIIERVLDLRLEYRSLPTQSDRIILARFTPVDHLIQINEEQLPLFSSLPFLERTVKGHEVGHYILHDNSHPHDYKFTKKINSPTEREAHIFSACLLIPRKIIQSLPSYFDFKGWDSFTYLRKYLGVTKQMLKLRLKELGILTQNRKGEFIGPEPFAFNYGKLKDERYE